MRISNDFGMFIFTMGALVTWSYYLALCLIFVIVIPPLSLIGVMFNILQVIMGKRIKKVRCMSSEKRKAIFDVQRG